MSRLVQVQTKTQILFALVVIIVTFIIFLLFKQQNIWLLRLSGR